MGAVSTFKVSAEPEILIRQVNGDLAISGWDRNEIHVSADGGNDDNFVTQSGDLVTIATDGDCALKAPLRSRLRIQSVDGDASITMLLGAITIDDVDGDLNVASVGPITINSVDGDLNVRTVAGSMQVNHVDGDAQVSKIAGSARLNAIDGDLAIYAVVGNVFATADGDANLNLQLAPGQTVTVAASGDILCQVQVDANATVRLTADGDIRVKNLGELRKASNTTVDFTLGSARNGEGGEDGGATLQLTADGDISLRGAAASTPETEFGFGDEFGAEMDRRAALLGAQITREVEMQVDALTRELEAKFNRMAENEEISARIQDKVAAAMRRAEEKLAEAMRKMEVRTQESEARQSGRDGRRTRRSPAPPPPVPPAPPAAPRKPQATDEERMMILRMVEQGKLSVNQAEKLLAALAGRKVER